MSYRTRADMFKADFVAGQSPFQSTGDISLSTAITDQILPLKGDFLYIDQASTGSVYVELNAKQGGTLAPVLLAAGGSIEIPDGGFDSIKINAAAQLNKSVRIIVGNGARIKGGANVNAASMSVSVVDGGLARTLAEKCFMSYASVGAVAAKYSHNQLWNPAGSGKNLFLKSLWAMSSTAQAVTHGYYSTALATSGNTPINKKLGSTIAAVGQTRTENNIATLYTGQGMSHYIKAADAYPVKFEEHFLIPPGYGYVTLAGTLNTDLTTAYEWYEE